MCVPIFSISEPAMVTRFLHLQPHHLCSLPLYFPRTQVTERGAAAASIAKPGIDGKLAAVQVGRLFGFSAMYEPHVALVC